MESVSTAGRQKPELQRDIRGDDPFGRHDETSSFGRKTKLVNTSGMNTQDTRLFFKNVHPMIKGVHFHAGKKQQGSQAYSSSGLH